MNLAVVFVAWCCGWIGFYSGFCVLGFGFDGWVGLLVCMVAWCACGLLVWWFVCVFVCLSFWCCLCVSRFGFGFLVCVCFSVCLRCVWYSGLFVFMAV